MRVLTVLGRALGQGAVVWALIAMMVLMGVVMGSCSDGHDAGHDAEMEAEVTEPEAPPMEADADASGPVCPGPDDAPCGDDCSNVPYETLDCWPSEYGPVEADVVLLTQGETHETTSSLLYCNPAPFALCFYSGPQEGIDGNPALPCTLADDGKTANCECVVFDSTPFFVDIYGILNAGAYFETIQQCGADGSGCANLANCGMDGSKANCPIDNQAPVCQYAANQNPSDNAVSLYPGADIISTFGFGMAADYPPGSVDCEGLYAGCMTAPCYADDDSGDPIQAGDTVRCECPTYDGPYQIGQGGAECLDPSSGYTWSASRSVVQESAAQETSAP